MSSNLYNMGGPSAASAYVSALEQAYRRQEEVYDPDYALEQDPDVYDVIQRDPETAHVIEQRKHLVAGTRWRLSAASDEEADRRAATCMEKLLKGVKLFGEARFQLAEAIFRGSAWALVTGRYEYRALVPGGERRRWWVPTGLQAVDKRRFRQVVDEAGAVAWEFFSVTRGRWEPLGAQRRWFVRVVYNKTEDSLGHGRGLVEPIYHWQYAKAKVLADGLAGLERWALGVVKAKIAAAPEGSDAKTNAAHAEEWLRVIEKMRSRHVLVHGDDAELDLLETSGKGHEMVKDFLSYLRDGIRVLVLGANLPTGATSGGSYALAEVQENSTENLVRFDRELLGESLTSDLLGLAWALNQEPLRAEGLDGACCPSLQIVSHLRRDMQAVASAVSTLLNAGVRNFREDEIFDGLGLTPAGPHDRQLEVVAPAGGGVGVGEAPPTGGVAAGS